VTQHHTLPRATIAIVKTKGGKEAHANITLQVPLDEAFGRIAAFLAASQELGCVVTVDIKVIEQQAKIPS